MTLIADHVTTVTLPTAGNWAWRLEEGQLTADRVPHGNERNKTAPLPPVFPDVGQRFGDIGACGRPAAAAAHPAVLHVRDGHAAA